MLAMAPDNQRDISGRTRAPDLIDLTLNSDDDSGPLDYLVSPPKSRSLSRKSLDLAHGNVRPPPSPPALKSTPSNVENRNELHLRQPSKAAINSSSYGIPRRVPLRTSSSLQSAPNGSEDNGTSYISPLPEEQRGKPIGFTNGKPGKRRRLLGPEEPARASSTVRISSSIPSVTDQHTQSISSLQDRCGADSLATLPTTSENASLQRALRRLPLPKDVEDTMVDWEDDNATPNFKFRKSPLKKGLAPVSEQPSAPSSSTTINDTPSFRPETNVYLVEEDRDSVISDSEAVVKVEPVDMPIAGRINAQHNTSLDKEQVGRAKKHSGGFSTEESHLLIFLKEVKRMPWKTLTDQFQIHFPGRKYHSLQSHYSMKLNKRNRTQDPSILNLPKCFASEAEIDWAVVHEANPRPRSQGMKRDLIEETISDSDSANRRQRLLRAIPVKDYTWPRQRRKLHASNELESEDEDEDEDEGFGLTEETDVETQSEQEVLIELFPENKSMDMNFERSDALFALSAQGLPSSLSRQKLPYIARSQRSTTRAMPNSYKRDELLVQHWQGALIHVDFSPVELDLVEEAILKVLDRTQPAHQANRRRRIQQGLQRLTEPKLLELSSRVRRLLPSRNRRSIGAFLQDAQVGSARIHSPRIERLATIRPDQDYSSQLRASWTSLVRQRELGLQSTRGWKSVSRPLSYQMRNKVQDSLGPAYTYTGASLDVHAVAWSPDGQCFAVGAICVDDTHSMQYNRPNNLLYGDLTYKSVHELGGHREARPITKSGPNSTYAMYNSQDPVLYKTVSSVAFSPNGKFMYSAGYDKCVRLWETRSDGAQPEMIAALSHKAEVELMTVNCNGLLSTASRRWTKRAIKLVTIDQDQPDNFSFDSFSSQKAIDRPELKLLPTALRFEPGDGSLLLAGFGANSREDGKNTNGDICLWDVRTKQQLYVHGNSINVFDVAFHPRQKLFAVGCSAGQNVNRGTRSVLRLYHDFGNNDKYTKQMELDCPALDMNDVVWCPHQEDLIAVGCTSGRVYVWDVRWPRRFLRELAHGRSLSPIDDGVDPETADTGVRFLSWGNNTTRLYTGSSDGVVKVWNVVRSEEETFIKDIVSLDSEIMSGSFSPDYSKLVLGENNGTVNVLEAGREDYAVNDVEKLKYIPYNDQPVSPRDSDSGVAQGTRLLESGQIVYMPMGGLPVRQAVQGPNYEGPIDPSIDAPFLREQALEFQCSLSQEQNPQCTISGCEDSLLKITSEETGDSGRSVDRIPDELRKQWTAMTSNTTTVPGRARCCSCGRAARPCITLSEDSVLCERCSFTCFRCGAANQIQPMTEIFACWRCGKRWEIGSLGYECIKETKSLADLSNVSAISFEDRSLTKVSADNVSFGDEMNALTDYYFSLAIDRPESPPL